MIPETRTIEITEKQRPLVKRIIESGRFNSANDIFDAALHSEDKRLQLINLLDEADREEAVEVDLDSFSKDIEAGKYR